MSEFINHQDFSPVMREEFIGLINDNPDNEKKAISSGISKMSSYLRNRFDVNIIFGGSDYPDKELIKEYLVDLVLYKLHARTRVIPEVRKERYLDAIAWLEGVSLGEIHPNLPALPSGELSSNDVRYGGGLLPQDNFDY